jgi:hypothetical protein
VRGTIIASDDADINACTNERGVLSSLRARKRQLDESAQYVNPNNRHVDRPAPYSCHDEMGYMPDMLEFRREITSAFLS